MWQVAHRSIRWLPFKTASYRCVVRCALTFMLRAAICDTARIFVDRAPGGTRAALGSQAVDMT